MSQQEVSRRAFLKTSAGLAGAAGIGILGFPAGTQIVEALAPGVQRITRSYSIASIARMSDLVQSEPLSFQYPLKEHNNFIVKLGVTAFDGVGPEQDIVAFNYLCPHMGCPLNGQYRDEYKMLGPCTCHYSRFDLAKNGVMILGQATQSLPQIVLDVDGDDILALGVTGLVYGAWNNLENGTPINA